MEIIKLVTAVVFLVVGIIAISLALSRPCVVEPITQSMPDGQEIVVEQSEQMDRMICLGTDKTALILMLIGTAAIFPGMSGLFKGITEQSKQ